MNDLTMNFVSWRFLMRRGSSLDRSWFIVEILLYEIIDEKQNHQINPKGI